MVRFYLEREGFSVGVGDGYHVETENVGDKPRRYVGAILMSGHEGSQLGAGDSAS